MLMLGLTLLGVLVFGALAVFLFRTLDPSPSAALKRAYDGLQVRTTPQPGDVVVLYHTYHGLIVTLVQTPHYAALPPDDARRLLGRLWRFNLSWGLLAYGAALVPIVGTMNYVLQRRSIARQVTAIAHNQALLEQPLTASDSNPYAASATIAPIAIPPPPSVVPQHKSLIFRAAGVILLVIAAISLLTAPAAAIATGSYEPLAALPGAALFALLGWSFWRG